MSPNIYVGVDWHKRTSTWVAINDQQEKVYCRSWGCTPSEVNQAISSLPAPPQNIILGVEPVCGWRWMTAICIERGVKDTQTANTKRLREIAETAKKTDKNDALTIAELVRMNYLPQAYRAPDEVHSLRVLVRQRNFLVRLGTATKCRIHGICTSLGAHRTADRPLLKDGRTKIAQGSDQELIDMYTLMDELERRKIEIEKRTEKAIKRTDLYHIVTSVPGIGPVTAAAIIAEVGDFKRFPSPSSLISYAGIYPREKSSGGRQHFGSMSKAGSRTLRYSIIEASMRVRDTENSRNLYSHYQAACKNRKKTPKKARVVLAHKMLTILWYLVQRNTLYDDRAVKPAQREMTS